MNADERERIVHEVAAKHLVPGDYEHALRELAVRVQKQTLLDALEYSQLPERKRACHMLYSVELERMAAAVK
jgi:hypothetical protein